MAGKTALTDQDRTSITAHVNTHVAGLASDKPEDIRSARTALLQPLRSDKVTASFRTTYSTALDDKLKPLVADKRDEVAINALRIAGDLGTNQGLEHLKAGLKDPRQSVRMMAAMGYGRSISSLRSGNTALLDSQIRDAIRTVAEAINDKQDPMVVEALVSSLADVALIPGSANAPLNTQPNAAMRMVEALAALAPNAKAEHAGAFTRATAALVTALTDQSVPTSNDTVKAGAGLAGDALVFVDWRLSSGELPQQERDRLAVLADQSARVIQLATPKLGGAAAPQATLRDGVLAGDAARFRADASKYLSALTQPPFGFPAARFNSRK